MNYVGSYVKFKFISLLFSLLILTWPVVVVVESLFPAAGERLSSVP